MSDNNTCKKYLRVMGGGPAKPERLRAPNLSTTMWELGNPKKSKQINASEVTIKCSSTHAFQ